MQSRVAAVAWAVLLFFLAACAAPPAGYLGERRHLSSEDEDRDDSDIREEQGPDRSIEPTGEPAAEALYDSPEVDAYFEQKLVEAGLPGMSAAVIRGGKTLWAKGYGFADIAKKKKADKDTLYMLASISKTAVAVALMQLIEDPSSGVTLDTDISTKLPFPVRNPRFPNVPITVRHLATHTSTLGDYYEYEPTPPGDPTVSLATWAKSYIASIDKWATWAPGTKWEYSNSGTALAALLVQHVTKMDFAEYTQKKIFEPLAMKQTAWFLRDLDVSRIAIPYDGIAPAFKALQHYGYPEYPSGELRSSAVQMARFLSMISRKGELDGKRVLKAATVDEMTRIQLPDVESTQGVFIYVQPHEGGVQALGHAGADFGVDTKMFFDPKDGAGYVLLMNNSPSAYWAHGGTPLPQSMITARELMQLELLALAKRIP